MKKFRRSPESKGMTGGGLSWIEVPAILLFIGALVGMIRTPGVLFFGLTFFAGLVWVGVRIAVLITRKLRAVKREITRVVGSHLQETLERYGIDLESDLGIREISRSAVDEPEGFSPEWWEQVRAVSDSALLPFKNAILSYIEREFVGKRSKHLSDSNYFKEVEEMGERLIALQVLTQKFDRILEAKLNPRELTYGRFSQAAHRTRELTILQLQETLLRIEAQAPRDEVERLLNTTEPLLSQLHQTSLALARMEGNERDRTRELEAHLEDLVRLEERIPSLSGFSKTISR